MIIRDVTYKELNKYFWTEDNRLQGMSDKNNGAWYNYDATGERNLKLTGQTMHVNQNGQDYYAPIFDQQTLYANPLITINDRGYTKHYFEEGRRICSKIGSGDLLDINTLVPHMETSYEEQQNIQREGLERTFRACMELTPEIATHNLHEKVVQPYEGPMNPGEPIFYYHSDHLGSASFLTDTNGIETQQLVYLPFGEDWVDMKYNTSQYDTPYKFNGKEKDEETGYNNFGARYYYDWASIWLSVDPMSDKYPSLTSYNYCANNPVMLVDPDGRAFGPPWKNKGPVIPKEKFLGWGNQPFQNNFERQNNRKPNCLDYSKAQMNVAGYTTGGAKDPTNMYTYDEKTGANAVVTAKAVEYIKGQLENDRPVLIGADKVDNQGINEGTTDHFMVVVGMGNDKKGNYFTVYDNASGKDPDKEGASPENKLYYDEKKNTISGRTKTSYSQKAEKDYTVSQVRETKELN